MASVHSLIESHLISCRFVASSLQASVTVFAGHAADILAAFSERVQLDNLCLVSQLHITHKEPSDASSFKYHKLLTLDSSSCHCCPSPSLISLAAFSSDIGLVVDISSLHKCPRCWKHSSSTGSRQLVSFFPLKSHSHTHTPENQLCERCAVVVNQ